MWITCRYLIYVKDNNMKMSRVEAFIYENDRSYYYEKLFGGVWPKFL